MGFPFHILNCSCWSCFVNGCQFVCIGSGTVRFPLVYTFNYLVCQWYQLCWRGKKNYAGILKIGILPIMQRNMPIKALSGGSNRPAHHTKVGEKLVRSFKRLLYTILGTRHLTDEVLNTAFYLMEYDFNARP